MELQGMHAHPRYHINLHVVHTCTHSCKSRLVLTHKINSSLRISSYSALTLKKDNSLQQIEVSCMSENSLSATKNDATADGRDTKRYVRHIFTASKTPVTLWEFHSQLGECW
eukprot:CFRG5324T1